MADSPRIAIVTGASKGIGGSLAKRLAADGFRLIVNYASSAAEARKVVADIEASGGVASAVAADVADPAGVRALFDVAEARYGPVDVLVNNAGILKVSPLADVSDEDYERQVAINLSGTFYGLREGARRLRDGGRIISISTSILGTNLPGHGVYAATKAAVEAMTRILAKELGPRGITVNAVAPGSVDTELFRSERSEEMIRDLTAGIPLGRLGKPNDIAGVVSFLAGPDGGWVNGQIIPRERRADLSKRIVYQQSFTDHCLPTIANRHTPPNCRCG